MVGQVVQSVDNSDIVWNERVMSEKETADTSASAGTSVSNLQQGRGGILGVKAGMTHVYGDQGEMIGVTVIDLQPNVVTQVKTKDKHGYQAVQIGFLNKRAKSVNKATKGHLKKSGIEDHGFKVVREFRLPNEADLTGLKEGQEINAGFLNDGAMVDIVSVSKGKGFQGTMKRHNFSGGYKSHGASLVHRSIGSIGNRADPGKVFKNRKMCGHMGHERVTVQNLRVVKLDLENRFLLLNGTVPGPKSGIVEIRKALKVKVAKATQAAE